jgi:hypothetical protein
LQELIAALTYYDITNRKDKSNPHRRWGYEEVKRWCVGEKMILPGEGLSRERGIPSYRFGEVTYIDKQELLQALAVNWEEGKKQLFRGLLSAYFKEFDAIAAGYCLDAEEEAKRQFGKEELLYWKTLYRLSGRKKELFWRGKIYAGLSELGRDLLAYLRRPKAVCPKAVCHEAVRPGEGEGEDEAVYFGSILENRILSAYLEQMAQEGSPIGQEGAQMTHERSQMGQGALAVEGAPIGQEVPMGRKVLAGADQYKDPEWGLAGHAGQDTELERELAAVKALEAAYRSHYKKRDKRLYLFLCGFMLSGEPVLHLGGQRFRTVSELIDHVKGLMVASYADFVELCHELIDEEDQPDPQLEGWLRALGKEAQLELWRQEILRVI